MSLFTISDLHLSFGSDKPMDIFGQRWENYTERLFSNWQKVVSENDYVVINGDISWAMNIEEAKSDFNFIESLNGKKIISKGNHDYWWTTVSKIEAFFSGNGIKSISILHNNAIDCGEYVVAGSRGWLVEGSTPHDDKITAREEMRLEMSLQAAEKIRNGREIIVFLHYPVAHNGAINNSVLGVLKKYDIKRVYFGHLHNILPQFVTRELEGIKMTLVSADFLSFLPLKI